MFFIILLSSLLFILMDEVLMGCWQSRIGPLNIGFFGLFSGFINGFNLMISNIMVPNLHFDFGFILFGVFYFVVSFCNYFYWFPFFIFGLFLSVFFFIFWSLLCFIFVLFCGFGGCSKFCILGCVSMISQFIVFELVFSLFYFFFVWCFFNLRVFLWFLS